MGKLTQGINRLHFRFTHNGDEVMIEKFKKLFSNLELFPLVLGCIESANNLHSHITFDSRRSVENVRERILKVCPQFKGDKNVYCIKTATNTRDISGNYLNPNDCPSYKYICKGYIKNVEPPKIFINSDVSIFTDEWILKTFEELRGFYKAKVSVSLTVGEVADALIEVKKERKKPPNFMRDLCVESDSWFKSEPWELFQDEFDWDDVSRWNVERVQDKIYKRMGELSKILDANIMARFVGGVYCYHKSKGMRRVIGDRALDILQIPVGQY